MTFQYLVWACVLCLAAASCTTPTEIRPTPEPSGTAVAATTTPSPAPLPPTTTPSPTPAPRGRYVVWTLDFEGDAASDTALANTAAIAEELHIPTTILWNPRVWTTTAVTPARAAAMLAWTKDRSAKGDEVGLHLHMWADYVGAAGVPPHPQPRWSGRDDGYDVPMTSYAEEQQRTLVAYGLRLMADHGMTSVFSFRAGGFFADSATIRVLAASGIGADCSGTPGGSFGGLRLPWTLPADAQPYFPSREDANKAGDLPLLEAPTNGGNTYGYTAVSIAPIVAEDLAILGQPADVPAARRALVIVSHPGTIDTTERAAIEKLLHSFDPYRTGGTPLQFVTLRQLAQIWR